MRFYNSLTGRVEEFKPIKEKEVKMYVCGSTVYNGMHIGNTRPIIFFDVVARFFKYLGYKVTYVSNFTDIDDKIIKKAAAEGVSEEEIANRYIKVILGTYKKLNILPHDANPRVTETMDDIVKFVQLLVDKKKAYIVDGDVYFDVDTVSDYGTLSGQKLDDLINGARVDENDKKKNPYDFNLWKETVDGVKWHTCFSDGRPGWHTECVVMINKILGSPIDIHGGGTDLKFPHHENERAQAIAAYDNGLANYWMHTGWIAIDNVKMSKSLGNTVDADKLVTDLGYGVYRLALLSAPYRQMVNYQEDLIKSSNNQYDKIVRAFIQLTRKLQISYDLVNPKAEIKKESFVNLNNEFIEALSDDFNISNAMTALDKVIKEVNVATRQNNLTKEELVELYTLFFNMLWVLGIEPHIEALNEEELSLVREWNEARANKDFAKADLLRSQISEKGIIL
ncbi:MAG: cysteine--tRNA ligase [Bacilli bacterium]|nr:cysteine--tRNA ligase [Bacilli bacterium]